MASVNMVANDGHKNNDRNHSMKRRRRVNPASSISSFTGILCFMLVLSVLPNTSAKEANSCIVSQTNRDEYECTDVPIKKRVTKAAGYSDGDTRLEEGTLPLVRLGVKQRIDGSESERKAVSNLLILMDQYYWNEVMSKPEYESVRFTW